VCILCSYQLVGPVVSYEISVLDMEEPISKPDHNIMEERGITRASVIYEGPVLTHDGNRFTNIGEITLIHKFFILFVSIAFFFSLVHSIVSLVMNLYVSSAISFAFSALGSIGILVSITQKRQEFIGWLCLFSFILTSSLVWTILTSVYEFSTSSPPPPPSNNPDFDPSSYFWWRRQMLVVATILASLYLFGGILASISGILMLLNFPERGQHHTRTSIGSNQANESLPTYEEDINKNRPPNYDDDEGV
jgi:hypothetical protein